MHIEFSRIINNKNALTFSNLRYYKNGIKIRLAW